MAKRKRRRLTDLQIEEVSFVPVPANKMPFTVIKSGGEADIDKAFRGLSVQFDTDGTYGGTKVVVNGREVKELTNFSLMAYPKPQMDKPISEADASRVPKDDAEMGLACNYTQASKAEANGGFQASYTYWLAKALDEDELDDLFKPYPNEHASRQNPPGKYASMRRKNNAFGPGVHAIYGVLESGKTEVQAIRFDRTKFTPAEAKAWLKEHDYAVALEAAAPVKKAAEADAATVAGYIGDVDGADPDVVAALASSLRVVDLYKQAMPPDLAEAINDISRLATDIEFVEVEVAKEGQTVPDDKKTEEQPKQEPIDVKALVEGAVASAIQTAVPAVVNQVVEALKPAAPAAPPPPPPAPEPKKDEDPEVTEEEAKQIMQDALAEVTEGEKS